MVETGCPKKKVFFLTDFRSVNYKIPGGVQLCTKELVSYLESSGNEVHIFPVSTTTNYLKKLKIKIGIEVYDKYDFQQLATTAATEINTHGINIVCLNQINLCPIVQYLRPLVSGHVKFVGISHGNESGDYLHDIAERKKPSLLEYWKLGKTLITESHIFKALLDGVIIISEHEEFINKWLGAQKVLVLPRILNAKFVKWTPVNGRIGFVGTLDHLPNFKGLKMIASSLENTGFKGTIRLVGGPSAQGELLQKQFKFVHYLGKLTENELEDEVTSWSIFMNPVFWYSRGSSTKLAQALEWGLPVLTTPAGRRGYVLRDPKIVIESHEPVAFAKAIIETYDSKLGLEELEKASKENVLNFDRQIYDENLQKFLQEL